MPEGKLFVFTGPSGTGKGTLLKELLSADRRLVYSISATTRDPRPGETDGVEYYFLSPEEFNRRVAAGEFLEYAQYVEHSYGTLKAPVEQMLQKGFDVALEIEVQGAAQVKSKCPDAVSVFIKPPSLEELAARLRGRGTEDEAAIEARLAQAAREMKSTDTFDFVVVNDEIDRAVQELRDILARKREESPL